MTKEEFIDKTAIANKTIKNLEQLIQKVVDTKNEGIEVFIVHNKKFDHNQRVKVSYKNEFIGYGYVKSVFVEEDYGILFYEITRENKETKEDEEVHFEYSNVAVNKDDQEYCSLTIERAF